LRNPTSRVQLLPTLLLLAHTPLPTGLLLSTPFLPPLRRPSAQASRSLLRNPTAFPRPQPQPSLRSHLGLPSPTLPPSPRNTPSNTRSRRYVSSFPSSRTPLPGTMSTTGSRTRASSL
jgi:hypothetical protein